MSDPKEPVITFTAMAVAFLGDAAKQMSEINNRTVAKRLEHYDQPPVRRAETSITVDVRAAGRRVTLQTSVDFLRWNDPDDEEKLLTYESHAVIAANNVVGMLLSALETTLGDENKPAEPKPLTPKEWMDIG